jgi:hypothetical protein
MLLRGPDHISSEAIEKAIRHQMSSTYQNDYLGIPQGETILRAMWVYTGNFLPGYQMDTAFYPQDDWKSRIPYTIDSSSRDAYQEPVQQPELRNKTKRYASNAKKHISASGIGESSFSFSS